MDHDGALGGFRAALTRFPDERLSVACLCNQQEIPAGQLTLSVASIYLGRTLPSLPGANPPAPPRQPFSGAIDLHQFEGSYFSEELNATYTLRAVGGKIKVSVRDIPFQEWTPVAPNELAGGTFEVLFEKPAAGRNLQFRLTSGRVKNLLFVKVAQYANSCLLLRRWHRCVSS